MDTKTNILVIDRSEIFRAGICQRLALRQDWRIFESEHENEPLKLIESRYINVALLDIDNPVSRGLELGREIGRHFPATKVVIMSPYFDDGELFEVIKSGASAYLDKRMVTREFISVIERVAAGEYVINENLLSRPQVAIKVLRQFQQMSTLGFLIKRVSAPLTDREIQILSYIAEGNTNKEIARLLGISDQTIKNHVSAILRKLNANDRAHAVAMAMQNRWITIDGPGEAGPLELPDISPFNAPASRQTS